MVREWSKPLGYSAIARAQYMFLYQATSMTSIQQITKLPLNPQPTPQQLEKGGGKTSANTNQIGAFYDYDTHDFS
jgi:hypothetical protein